MGHAAVVSAPELQRAREILVELVEIPSVSGAEGRIINHLEKFSQRLGFQTRRVPSEVGRDSLVVGSSLSPDLAIVAHVDTIRPDWEGGNTGSRIDGNIVAGLGSVDDKGGVAACLLAMEALAAAGNTLDGTGTGSVVFAFAVDEEEGGSGSRSLASTLKPKRAVAMEGTRLRPGIVEVGDIEGWVHVEGKTAHGSLAELGDNAIHRAAELIAALPSLGLEKSEHPLIGTSQASVTEIRSAEGGNAVPDLCSLLLRTRIVPGQDQVQVLAQVEKFAAGFNATVQLVEVTAPFEVPEDAPLVEALRHSAETVLGERPAIIGVLAWTDAHNFVDFAGSESIVFGPGDIATAHTPDEHIDVTEVVLCARIFEDLISGPGLATLSGPSQVKTGKRFAGGTA